MAQDLNHFAYSFSHGIVKINDRQFTDVSGVQISQELTESATYGTDIGPQKRSVGQLQMGKGQLLFSDMGEAVDFFKFLGEQPFLAIWSFDYVLNRPDGSLRSVECRACRLTSFQLDHAAGADALGATYPFSFMAMRVDGVDLVLSPRRLLQAGIAIAQNLANLL